MDGAVFFALQILSGTGIFQFCLGLGLVVAAGAGCLIAMYYGASDSANIDAAGKTAAWSANFWWTMIPVAVLFFGSFSLPESPVWLSGGHKKAKDSSFVKHEGGSLLQRRYVVPFLLAVIVLTLNKTTGMSSFTSYLVSILQGSGLDGMAANWGQLVVKTSNMLFTIAAAALIDRVGRVKLLKLGTGGMALFLGVIASIFLAVERFGVEATNLTGSLMLVSFIFMQAFYALGPGICVWLVLSELMPTRIRANGMACALFMNQLVAWALASWFRPWIEAWGWSSMFFFFAANGVLYFIVSFFIPETKGKPIEELEHLFDKKTTPNP